MHRCRQRVSLGPCLILCLCFHASASDWPQFLGPTRNAVYAGPPLAEEWPATGPPVVWSADVGEGYSSPVVGEERLVICHRIENDLIIDCFDSKTGRKHWSFKHPMQFRDGAYFDSGPRPTPTIKEGRVFAANTDGYLVCLDLKNGEKVWSRQPTSEFKRSGTWHGCVASPLVTEKAVILPVGGTNAAGVVAFARATGEILWQALDEKAGAASPVLATFDGKPQVLVLSRVALHSLDPETGTNYWQVPTRRQTTGNVYAASPVVFGDQIFLSAWYQLGAQLLRVKHGQPEEIWRRADAISTRYANGTVFEGHLYGFHGHAWERGGPSLRCIELATGKVVWEQPQAGSGTIIRAGGDLLILSDTGELQLAKASPKEFKIKARAQVVGRTTRSYAASADGFVFVTDPRKLVCLDLRVNKRA